MYEENVTKNAWKSDNWNESLKKGIRVPLAQVTNPKMKNKAQMISIGITYRRLFSAAAVAVSGCIDFGIED